MFFVAFTMFQPILMNNIMSYIRNEDKNTTQSIIYYVAIFLVTSTSSTLITHMFYHFAVLGFNVSNNLSSLLFKKALKHPILCEKTYSTSDLINYSQVDAQRMTNMGFQLTSLLFTPIQITVGLVLLYVYIGISFVVGLGVMIVMMIFTLIFSKVAAKAND